MEFSCIRMRNCAGDALDFSFQVWVGRSVLLVQEKFNLKFQTALKVLMVLMYLYMVFTFRQWPYWKDFEGLESWWEVCIWENIKLMTTVAKALQVCFLLPFELCVHNSLHNWSFTRPNSVYIYLLIHGVCSQCAYLQCIELCWVMSAVISLDCGFTLFDMKVILCF